jgi:hypothetical protein
MKKTLAFVGVAGLALAITATAVAQQKPGDFELAKE